VCEREREREKALLGIFQNFLEFLPVLTEVSELLPVINDFS
jgi:hypothetical protein